MTLKLRIIFLLFLCISCSSSKTYLKLNSRFDEINNEGTQKKILIPSGNFINSLEIIEDNIVYNIGISSNNKIIFISTIDTNFIIDNLKINNALSDRYNKVELEYIRGWGYYIPIKDGWYAGFDYNETPNQKSKIKWFFKYNFEKHN